MGLPVFIETALPDTNSRDKDWNAPLYKNKGAPEKRDS